jgi:hypothetical protein
MPATYLNTSTLSEAVSKDANEFTVGSTTNIVVDDLLVFLGGEAMKVQAIPVAGRVQVRRGVSGTRALSYPSGAKFFIGSPDKFKQIRDNAAAIIGDNGTLPDYCLPGIRGRDSVGNEYIMVDLTGSAVLGATVVFSRDGNFTASIITSTSRGSVGILTEGGTSNQWVWAQVYGAHAHAKLVIGSSLATSLGELQGATSVSTPSVGLLGRSSSQRSSNADAPIHGMYLTGAATTASTATCTSETGFYAPVWLEYPWMDPFTS